MEAEGPRGGGMAGKKTIFMNFLRLLLYVQLCLAIPAQAEVQMPRLSAGDGIDASRVARLYQEAGWTIDTKVQGERRNNTDRRPDFLGEIGNRPIANMQSDGRLLRGAQVRAEGMPPYIVRALDAANGVDVPAIRMELNPRAKLTARSWRTQIADAPIPPYQRYAWVLTFKLDSSWDTTLIKQRGLIWQLYGNHRAGQHGNPVIAFNLDRDELYCSILYPKAERLPERSEDYVRWGPGQYIPQSFPRKALQPGRYHTLQIEMFADDRTTDDGGRGYMKVAFDGEPWINYIGPTLQPDQAGPHLPIWGWYQWEAPPSQPRIVWWAINQMYIDQLTYPITAD